MKNSLPLPTHAELVEQGRRWLRRTRRLSIVLAEFRTTTGSENPDCIGWTGWGWSVLIECKISRADFLRDKHKVARRNPESAMGQERFFLAPVGMLRPSELPPGWGLLEAGKRVRMVHPAIKGSGHVDPNVVTHVGVLDVRRQQAEMAYLLAFVRRLLGITKIQSGGSVPDDIRNLLAMVLGRTKLAVAAPLVTAAVVG